MRRDKLVASNENDQWVRGASNQMYVAAAAAALNPEFKINQLTSAVVYISAENIFHQIRVTIRV